MASGRLPISTTLIIVLLTINIGLTAYIAFGTRSGPSAVLSEKTTTNAISRAEADKLAAEIVPLFNAGDIPTLYARFDPLAKVQFTQEKLATDMEKLGKLLGSIKECAYSHAELAGKQGGRTYYFLYYEVRLSGGTFPTGELKVTVTRTDTGISLFGFFLNGKSVAGRE